MLNNEKVKEKTVKCIFLKIMEDGGRLRNRSTTIKTSSANSTEEEEDLFSENNSKNSNNNNGNGRNNQNEYLISIPFPWVSLGSVILPLSAFVYCIGEYIYNNFMWMLISEKIPDSEFIIMNIRRNFLCVRRDTIWWAMALRQISNLHFPLIF